MRKELFCHDERAIERLKRHTYFVMELVNVWAIPLLKSIGQEATPENIRKAVKYGVKEYLIDEITSVAISDARALAARQAYRAEAERILHDAIARLVKATDAYKAIDAAVQGYKRETWQGVKVVAEHERSEEAKEKMREKAIERGVVDFNDCLARYKNCCPKLEDGLRQGIFKWGENGLEYCEEKVNEQCAIYLEGKAEIDCVKGLESIIAAINAAYKNGLPDIRYLTYLIGVKDGTAYLDRQEVGIDDLERYGPYIN